MADFNTHLSVGIAVSGVCASAAMVAGLADRAEVLPCFLLGAIGGLLPDVDADYSTPLQIAFTLFSIVIAFLLMFAAAIHFTSLAELLLVWLAGYLAIRWGVFQLFTRHTTHRGMIHSLPVAAASGIFTAAIAYWLFELPSLKAWLYGAFVTLGFLTHLLLDEISAINLFGIRSRRSFGSAMKLWYRNSWRATLAAYIALAITLPLAPPIHDFRDAILDLSPRAMLEDKLFPEGGWFAI